jgi:hypothetical protein
MDRLMQGLNLGGLGGFGGLPGAGAAAPPPGGTHAASPVTQPAAAAPITSMPTRLGSLAGLGGLGGAGLLGGLGGSAGAGSSGGGGLSGAGLLGGIPSPFGPATGIRPGVSATTPVEAERPPIGVRPPPGVSFPIAVDTPIFTGPPIATRPPIQTLPPIFFPPLILQINKTATQLARSGIVTLNDASVDVVTQALDTIRGRNLRAPGLIDYLERRVKIGEVLNQLATTWSDTTVGDFAEALQMPRDRRDVMDAIVAIAILNEADLEEQLLAENLPDASQEDLLDNRVIVEQWPPGGTVMQPPYVVLVAVEYRNISQAQEVVDSIMNELVDHEGVKLTRTAAEKLRGR